MSNILLKIIFYKLILEILGDRGNDGMPGLPVSSFNYKIIIIIIIIMRD